MSRPPIITLTTDFGLTDGYVAAMKGVVLGIAPGAQVVDVSHDIASQNIAGAGYVLESVLPYFPPDTVHVVVVDPGVGTERAPVAVQTPTCFLVGPDNGVMTAPLVSLGCVSQTTGQLCGGAHAVRIQNPALLRPNISHTFHGRDVFAPAAAHLASGVPATRLGPPVKRLRTVIVPAPVLETAEVAGEIIHIDHFGNAISNIRTAAIPSPAVIEVRGTAIDGLSETYQERPITAVTGGTGYLEIAVRDGSAAEVLGIRVGDRVVLRRAE